MKHYILTLLIFIVVLVIGCQESNVAPKSKSVQSEVTLKSIGSHPFRMFFRGQTSNNLYYANSLAGTSWSQPAQFGSGIGTSAAPAAAFWDGWYYAAYKGGSSTNLYVSYSDDGITWTPTSPISGARTDDSPGLVLFNNELYVFFIGTSLTGVYYSKSSNGEHWSAPIQIVGTRTRGGVAAVVNPSTNKINVFFQDINDAYLKVIYGTPDGAGNVNFSGAQTVKDCNDNAIQTLNGVGATYHNGLIYVAFTHLQNNNLSVLTLGTCQAFTNKSNIISNLNAQTNGRPGLASSVGKLLIVYKSESSGSIRYQSYDDINNQWFLPQIATGNTSSGIALIAAD